MIRPPPRSTPLYSSAASDVYKRQVDSRWTLCPCRAWKVVAASGWGPYPIAATEGRATEGEERRGSGLQWPGVASRRALAWGSRPSVGGKTEQEAACGGVRGVDTVWV